MGGKWKQALYEEGNVIWGGSLMDDSSVIYRLLVLLSTFVTCNEILGCLVPSITYIPLSQRSFLGSKSGLCWAWELTIAQSCHRRWPGRYGGAILNLRLPTNMTYGNERELAKSRTEPLGPLEYRPRFRILLGSLGTEQDTQRLWWNAEKSNVDQSNLQVNRPIKDSIKVFLRLGNGKLVWLPRFQIKSTLKAETSVFWNACFWLKSALASEFKNLYLTSGISHSYPRQADLRPVDRIPNMLS